MQLLAAKMKGLTFNAEKHEYRYDGMIVPSVTEIIRDMGMTAKEEPFFSEFYADRGRKIHRGTLLVDRGTIDWNAIDPEIEPYLRAYELFLKEHTVEWFMSEEPVFCEEFYYAGTPDRLGFIDNELVLPDFKSGQYSKWHRLQVAAYKRALKINCKGIGLYLQKTKKYKIEDLSGANKAWESCVYLYHWRRK